MKVIEKYHMAAAFGADKASDRSFESARTLALLNLEDDLGPELIAAIEAMDPEDSATQATELFKFWDGFVKQAAVWMTYSELLPNHGMTIAAQGVVKFGDSSNTTSAPSKNERADMIEQAEQFASRYRDKMKAELAEKDSTFDGTTYKEAEEPRTQPELGISAIGKLKPSRFKNRL